MFYAEDKSCLICDEKEKEKEKERRAEADIANKAMD